MKKTVHETQQVNNRLGTGRTTLTIPCEGGTVSHLLVYDGECGLCARSVQFVLKHDKAAVYRFTAVQSPLGVSVYAGLGLDPKRITTLVVLIEGRSFVKSDAVLRLALSFGSLWRVLAVFLLLPRRLRDAAYDWVAARRHRWFAGSSQCLFSPEFRRRML